MAVRSPVLSDGNEVGEGVALDEHFAGVVPGLAEIAAAADVGIGHNDAAVEQAEAVGAEAERERVAVGAVAVDVGDWMTRTRTSAPWPAGSTAVHPDWRLAVDLDLTLAVDLDLTVAGLGAGLLR